MPTRDFDTGIVDLDIHGPNIPKMLGVDEDRRLESRDGKTIEPVRLTGTAGCRFHGIPASGKIQSGLSGAVP